MGVAVVGGMTIATFLGIFLIPVFFVVVQNIVQKIFGKDKVLEKDSPSTIESNSKPE